MEFSSLVVVGAGGGLGQYAGTFSWVLIGNPQLTDFLVVQYGLARGAKVIGVDTGEKK